MSASDGPDKFEAHCDVRNRSVTIRLSSPD